MNAPAAASPLPSLWPQGVAPPLKITDSLTLAIPRKYLRTAISPDAPQRALLSVQTDRAEARFDFFWPDLGGYTLQNYRNEFDENRVEVVYLHAGNAHEADADAPGEYPPNVLRRLMPDLDARAPRMLYGLECYRGTVQSDRLTCYGRRSADEDILLTVKVPPFAPADTFPMIQTRYYSRRYGGVRLAWRAHVKNFPRWHDIDGQIWKFIDAWSVAQPAPPQH
ncbi:MAG TPA: hypothetical protein VH111_08625 [Steroidobacteraceae bacterium]|nr:hypothetical protein [Steroidobacteraceae bacterium]